MRSGEGPSDRLQAFDHARYVPRSGFSGSFRRSGRCSRRSAKPSAQPMLVRTRHLPPLLARRKAPIKTTLAVAAQRHKALLALSWHIAAHVEMPSFHPRRRGRVLRSPTSTAPEHRFWMAAAILTVSIPGIPNNRADLACRHSCRRDARHGIRRADRAHRGGGQQTADSSTGCLIAGAEHLARE